MDSKKILEKLFKIASNQQKIIEKLAQFAPGTKGDPLADFDDKSLETSKPAAPKPAAPKPAAPKPAAPKPAATPGTTPWANVDTTGYWDAAPAVRQPTSTVVGDPNDKSRRQPTSMTRGPNDKPMDISHADDALPADLVAALDANVIATKGALKLELNGKAVTVKYDLNRIKAGANKVKEVMEATLAPAGYQVVSVIGETGLIPNYR